MNVEFFESMSKIRKRSPDRSRARSLAEAAEKTMHTISEMPLTNGNATIIFRETYESIRQLGDARWWLWGYEPRDHEVSMEILKEEKIPNSAKLAKLDRFRAIRNDANYSGYSVPKAVTAEILEFWGECGEEILANLKKDLG